MANHQQQQHHHHHHHHQQQQQQQYLSSASLFAAASSSHPGGGNSFAMAAVPPPPPPPPSSASPLSPPPPPPPNINSVVNVSHLQHQQHHHILKPDHRSNLGTLMLSPTAPMQLNASRPPKLHVGGINMDLQESSSKVLEERPAKRSSLFYTNASFSPNYTNEVMSIGSNNIGDAELEYMDQDGYLLNEDAMIGGDGQKLVKGVRRLGYEQVKALERAFEGDNRLEPERKVKLASQLGLQPRQVAVWFQNRRARWKTKQLEKDYSVLKSNFDALKVERDKLLQEKQNLQSQLAKLKGDVVENIITNAQGEQDSTTLTSHSNILNQDKLMQNNQNLETKSSSQKQDNDSVSSIEDSESNGAIDEPSSVTIMQDSTKLLPNENDFYNNHWRLPQNQHAYKPNVKSEETWENVEESGSFNAPIDWYW